MAVLAAGGSVLTLADAEREGYMPREIRDYSEDDPIRILFVHPKGKEVHLSLKAIRENRPNCEAASSAGKFSVLVSFNGNVLLQPIVLRILLKYFFKVNFNLDLTPCQFALCCYDIYSFTGKLIFVPYINSMMGDLLKDLNAATNLNDAQLKELRELHTKRFPKSSWRNDKNAVLVKYLAEREFHFHPEYATRFCADNTPLMQSIVRRLFPGKISFGPPKSAVRIRQKYAEYADQFLAPNTRVYGKFKDLFRASIAFEDYIRHVRDGNALLPISSIKERPDGSYQACYVVLNIESFNFEVKVVKSLEVLQESHEWYELSRNNTLENLEDFIKRCIACTAVNQLVDGTVPPAPPSPDPAQPAVSIPCHPSLSPNSIVRLKLKAYGTYLHAHPHQFTGPLGGGFGRVAHSNLQAPSMQFRIVPAVVEGASVLAFQANHDAYIRAGADKVVNQQATIKSWEQFEVLLNSDGTVSLRSFEHGTYIHAKKPPASEVEMIIERKRDDGSKFVIELQL